MHTQASTFLLSVRFITHCYHFVDPNLTAWNYPKPKNGLVSILVPLNSHPNCAHVAFVVFWRLLDRHTNS